MNFEFWFLNFDSFILYFEYCILNLEIWILICKFWILNLEFWLFKFNVDDPWISVRFFFKIRVQIIKIYLSSNENVVFEKISRDPKAAVDFSQIQSEFVNKFLQQYKEKRGHIRFTCVRNFISIDRVIPEIQRLEFFEIFIFPFFRAVCSPNSRTHTFGIFFKPLFRTFHTIFSILP